MDSCPFCEKTFKGTFEEHLLDNHVKNYLELNQLVLSLTQINHEGDGVYFVQGAVGSQIKIGKSKNLQSRLIGLQTGNPIPLKVLLFAPGSEAYLHQRFKFDRVQGEWFSPSFPLLTFISRAIVELRSGTNILFSDSPLQSSGPRRTVTKPKLKTIATRVEAPDPEYARQALREYLKSDHTVKSLVEAHKKYLLLRDSV
jgi:hypothetical protein